MQQEEALGKGAAAAVVWGAVEPQQEQRVIVSWRDWQANRGSSNVARAPIDSWEVADFEKLAEALGRVLQLRQEVLFVVGEELDLP